MNRTSRWIILAALLLTAAFLHHATCAWLFNDLVGARRLLIGYDPRSVRDGGTGVFYRWSDQVPLSALVGVAIPFLLVVTAIALPMEWRRRDRIAKGACPCCGHAGTAQAVDRCSECGAVRPASPLGSSSHPGS